MTVKDLRRRLPVGDDGCEVIVRMRVPDFEPDVMLLDIQGIRLEIDPDTALPIVLLDCCE